MSVRMTQAMQLLARELDNLLRRSMAPGMIANQKSAVTTAEDAGRRLSLSSFGERGQEPLIVGDVLLELNILTGRRGPQIGPAAFNASSDQTLESLPKLKDVEADVVLFGHGDAWTGGIDAAITAARAAGKS